MMPNDSDEYLTVKIDLTINKTCNIGEVIKLPTRVTKKIFRDKLEDKYGKCEEITILADGVPIGKKSKELKMTKKIQVVMRKLTESETL